MSAGLVKNQPGDPSDPEADEQALLSHMREKLFTIMPTLAETILNRERSGRAPADSYELGELLERYQLSIETHLRSVRSQANHRWHQNPVNDLSVEFEVDNPAVDSTSKTLKGKSTPGAKMHN